MASAGAFSKESDALTGLQKNLIDARGGVDDAVTHNPIDTVSRLNFGQDQISGFGAEEAAQAHHTALRDYLGTPELGVSHLRAQLNTLVGVSFNAAGIYQNAALNEAAAAAYIHRSLDGAF